MCASFSVNSNLTVFPSVQAAIRGKPNAAISGRQDGPNVAIGQTLLHGNGGYGQVAKPVEAANRCYPNISFPIFKETSNEIV
jgi:hypothetical protein